MERSKTSVREHIKELRRRLLSITAVFVLVSSVAYAYHARVIEVLVSPLHHSVYYSTPQGGFEFIMRVVLTLGLIGAVPVMVYQTIKFAEPALGHTFSAKFLRSILLRSLMLMAFGIAFGYMIILPTTLTFFAGFTSSNVKALISANDYLNLVLGVMATFALIFQLPLIIEIVDHIRPLKPKQLTKYRRHVVVGSLVLALVLPFTYDPVTQFVMALPIILLFELSVFTVWSRERNQLRQAKLAQRRAARTRRRGAGEANEQSRGEEIGEKGATAPGVPPSLHPVHAVASVRNVDSVRQQSSRVLDLRAIS